MAEPAVAEEQAASGCCSAPVAGLTGVGGQVTVEGGVQTSMRIMQMDCPTEEGMIRKSWGRWIVSATWNSILCNGY
ncbi:hypothetical protein [Aliamphritea spongicola]